MCRTLVLRAPLASAEEEKQVDLADLRARTLEEVNDDLRWMATLARAVGLDSLETDEAEDAISTPVGDSELLRMRGMQIREEAADALAALLRATGHQSPVIEYWAGPGAYERRVRPRLE
jgi:hypothetical protein